MGRAEQLMWRGPAHANGHMFSHTWLVNGQRRRCVIGRIWFRVRITDTYASCRDWFADAGVNLDEPGHRGAWGLDRTSRGTDSMFDPNYIGMDGDGNDVYRDE